MTRLATFASFRCRCCERAPTFFPFQVSLSLSPSPLYNQMGTSPDSLIIHASANAVA